MTQHAITHLLVVSNGNEAANRLLSGLRTEGMASRAASASSGQELAALLSQDQWDLLVCYDTAPITLENTLALLKKNEQDIPVILVTGTAAPADPLPLFKLGVRDVLRQDQHAQLLTSVRREAEHYQLKRQCRRLELQHKELEKRHQLVLAGSATAISYVQDGVHLYCNQSYADSFGYDSIKSISTTPLLNLISATERARIKTLLAQALSEETAAEVLTCAQDGSEIPRLLTFTPVDYHGKACLQLSIKPASGNAGHLAAVAVLGTQDLLTRLDNRSHFLTRIEGAIRQAVQDSVFSSLLLIEMDEFVDISSAIGKSNANIVLNDIAVFLQDVIEKPFAAARLEDHQFGILLYDGDPEEALALATEIRSRINRHISPALLASLELSCSIGMALINGHAHDAEAMLRRAQNNLQQTPLEAGSNYQFSFGDSLRHDAAELLDYLKLALQQQRFKLLFQPLVCTRGDTLRRYEVLARMLDNDGNDVVPVAFMPLAILNGMGESIDRLVLGMALDAIGGDSTAERLLINITSNTLLSQTSLPWLSERLRAGRIPSDLLVLQISEMDIHNNPAQASEFCRGLHELNVRIAITHFGCALDPFAILDDIGPTFIKLDETLARDIIYSAQQKSTVHELIRKLHARKLQVIVPQVEDIDALPILWENGADFVQGHCLQGPSDTMNYEFEQAEEITLSAA